MIISSRVLARLVPATLVASLFAVIPVVDPIAAPEPVPAQRDSIPITGVDRAALEAAPAVPAAKGRSGDQVVALTPQVDTRDFTVAGVTWQGHRNVGQTACPGRYLHARMDEIRAGAKARQGSAFHHPMTAPRNVPDGTGGSQLKVGTGGYITWRVRITNR